MKYLVFGLMLAVINVPAAAAVSYYGSVSTVTSRIGPADGLHDESITNSTIVPAPYETSIFRDLVSAQGYTEVVSSIKVTEQTEQSGTILFFQSLVNSGIATPAAAFGQFNSFFDITAPVLFSVDYSITIMEEGVVVLSSLAQQAFIDDASGNYYLSFDPLFGNGSMSVLLPAGSYAFRVQDFSTNQIVAADVQRTLSSQFRYTLSPVSAIPEPATWAMLILGFVLVGTEMRRKARVNVLYDCRR